MPQFDFKHKQIAFSDSGVGHALLLIPGLGGQFSFWVNTTEVLKQHFRAISFDHPGSGGSAGLEGQVTLEGIADLAFALLDHLGLNQVHVIGQSMGGAVAQIMALRCPDRIDKLILSSTWASPDNAFERGFGLRRQILTEIGLEAYAKAQVLAVMSAAQIATNPDQAASWEQKTIENSDREALLTRINALMAFDNAEHAPQISQPTLVIGAADDQVVPIHMSKQLAGLIPDARLQILPEGGHFAPMTDSDSYLKQVLPFLMDTPTPLAEVSVLLIGCGAIGRHIIKATRDIPGIKIRTVLVRPERVETYSRQLGTDVVVSSDMAELKDIPLDYTVECAGHEGLRQFGPEVLRYGLDLGILSAGAITDDHTAQSLKNAARNGAARIEILSGALAGTDALRALAGAGIETVHLTSRKPPGAWRGSAAEKETDLDMCNAPVTLFTGSAREAAQLYPKNANVSAITALMGLGPGKTKVTLIADPSITQNSHELTVSGAFGAFSTTLQSNPLCQSQSKMGPCRGVKMGHFG